ncbi:MAG: hypothetical protein P8N09_09695 [Planctomycetota bacterium]|nr:hypothetical protein [Planctomycetota bacterium]
MRTLIATGLLGLALLPSCSGLGSGGENISAGEYRELEREAAARRPSRVSTAESEKRRREIEERSRKLDEQRAEHAHEVAKLASRLTVLEIDQAMAAAEETIDLARAEREVQIAQDDLSHFQVIESERRLRRGELTLQASMDRLLDTREELAQLELMYGASELGDATAEIVLERTRRGLMLAELRYKLTEQEVGELETRELPRELEELKAAMLEKTVALANAKRRLEKDALKREIARSDLAYEEAKSLREQAAIAEVARLLELDRKEWNQEQDDSRRGSML